MPTPKYVERIARLPKVFEILEAHPEGLPLSTLADEVGAAEDTLREDLLAYYSADNWSLGLSRPHVLEFIGRSGEDEDPNQAEIVRIVEPASDLGVEYLDAGELALIYTAAASVLEIEPVDTELAEALAVITETMFGEPGDEPRPGPLTSLLSPLRLALADGRQVRIAYSRQWPEGVGSRVIEPYRLVQTRRGWEIDAGPVDSDGAIRTFLLSNIRSAEVLPSTYVMPADVSALVAAQRRTTRVTMQLPHDARWAADMYAESLTVVADDDETFTAELELLPPIEGRVGLVMLAGGESTRVLSPGALVAAGPALAKELWQHHAGCVRVSPQPGE